MGLYSAMQRSACGCEASQREMEQRAKEALRPKQPNPENFKILRTMPVGRYLVAEVLYPDCTNFEGRKVLLYEDVTDLKLSQQTALDPHFCNNPRCVSPIARFEPTQRGWTMAVQMAAQLVKEYP